MLLENENIYIVDIVKRIMTIMDHNIDSEEARNQKLRDIETASRLAALGYDELIRKIQPGNEPIDPKIVGNTLKELARESDEDHFRELVNSYIEHLMNEPPFYSEVRGVKRKIEGCFSNRKQALKFIDYVCLAADYGVSSLIRFDETQKSNLEIRETQEALHRLFQAPFAYK